MTMAPPPPSQPGRRWLLPAIAVMLALCLCCLLSLAVLWVRGDDLVRTLCRNAPGLIPAQTCIAVGAP